MSSAHILDIRVKRLEQDWISAISNLQVILLLLLFIIIYICDVRIQLIDRVNGEELLQEKED